MFVLDRLLIGGLRFVFEQVRNAAESELEENPEVLRERLLEAQMRLELGEIGEEEFDRIEREVLAALRQLQGGGEPISFGASRADVDVTYDAGDDEETDAG